MQPDKNVWREVGIGVPEQWTVPSECESVHVASNPDSLLNYKNSLLIAGLKPGLGL